MTAPGSNRWTFIFLITVAVFAGLAAMYSLTRDESEPETDNEADLAAAGVARQTGGADPALSESRVASIRGRVIDEHDGPVAGAQVCASVLSKARLSLTERRRRHCTKSDHAGRFSLTCSRSWTHGQRPTPRTR